MGKESVVKAILTMRCPKCHEGKLFEHANPYSFSKIHQMPSTCPNCGQQFEPEPGFYYGAMYVNYAFTVVLLALAYIVLELWLQVPPIAFFSIFISSILLLAPFLFRYSRVLFLYIFVRYDKEASPKHKTSH
jgi:uncharacterized protein (DUF983 family)